MTHTRVVNVRDRKKGVTWDVYAGRGRCPCGPRCAHFGGFGNPYPPEEHGERAPLLYVDHVAERLRTQMGFRHAIAALKGKVIGCWCAPAPCHANVLARLADGEDIRSIRADVEAHGFGGRP